MRPYIWIAVGLPASGKSTWIKKNVEVRTTQDIVVLGTDRLIDQYAAECNMTYDEIWPHRIDDATDVFFAQVKTALAARRNIFIDRTNISVKSRRKILAHVPKDYHKIACVYTCSPEVHEDRLHSRPGKFIPQLVIENMKKDFAYPTLDEGFDQINHIITDHTAPVYTVGGVKE